MKNHAIVRISENALCGLLMVYTAVLPVIKNSAQIRIYKRYTVG